MCFLSGQETVLHFLGSPLQFATSCYYIKHLDAAPNFWTLHLPGKSFACSGIVLLQKYGRQQWPYLNEQGVRSSESKFWKIYHPKFKCFRWVPVTLHLSDRSANTLDGRTELLNSHFTPSFNLSSIRGTPGTATSSPRCSPSSHSGMYFRWGFSSPGHHPMKCGNRAWWDI